MVNASETPGKECCQCLLGSSIGTAPPTVPCSVWSGVTPLQELEMAMNVGAETQQQQRVSVAAPARVTPTRSVVDLGGSTSSRWPVTVRVAMFRVLLVLHGLRRKSGWFRRR